VLHLELLSEKTTPASQSPRQAGGEPRWQITSTLPLPTCHLPGFGPVPPETKNMSPCKQPGSTEPVSAGSQSFSTRNKVCSLLQLRLPRAWQKGAACLPFMLLTLIYYTCFERRLIFQIIKINRCIIPQLSYKLLWNGQQVSHTSRLGNVGYRKERERKFKEQVSVVSNLTIRLFGLWPHSSTRMTGILRCTWSRDTPPKKWHFTTSRRQNKYHRLTKSLRYLSFWSSLFSADSLRKDIFLGGL